MNVEETDLKPLSSRAKALYIKEAMKDLKDLPQYTHKDYRGNEVHYKPLKHAKARKVINRGNFRFVYSIPKKGGAAILSLWMEPKNKDVTGVKIHLDIDLDELVGTMIEHRLSGDYQKISEPWTSRWTWLKANQTA